MWFPGPTRPMAPGSWSVLIVVLLLALVAFGGVCLYFGFRAAPQEAETAAQVRIIGYGSFIAAAAFGFGYWLYRRAVG